MTENDPIDPAEQLRRLGEAAEAAVAPVTAAEAQEPTGRSIAVQSPSMPGVASPSRRRTPMLVAAGVLLIAAIGSLALFNRGGDDGGDFATAASSATVAFDDNGWGDLRQCESEGNYKADTGNSFYGAYQFTRTAWQAATVGLGLEAWGDVLASTAPAEIQDAAAAEIYRLDGAAPWPVCGRFLRGPMVTPVVGPWLPPSPQSPDPAAIVFLNPSATGGDIEETRIEIGRLLAGIEHSVEFVDQQRALEEFREMFADSDDVRASVDRHDMPASFRIDMPDDAIDALDPIRGRPSTFQVTTTTNDPLLLGRGRSRLRVPDLGVDAALYTSARIDHLATGAAVLQRRGASISEVQQLVIAARGVGSAALFSALDQLEPGSIIEVDVLFDTVNDRRITTRYVVTDTSAPKSLDELDASPWEGGFDLVLVTDTDNPNERLVVGASVAPAELDRFGDEGTTG